MEHKIIKKEIIHQLILDDEELYTLTCIAFHFKENLLKKEHNFANQIVNMVDELIKKKRN